MPTDHIMRSASRARTHVSEDKFPSHLDKTHSPRVFGLDLLRALAIAGVVGAHASSLIIPHLPWWFNIVSHGGFYGVELFFVLSGFLIGRILVGTGEQLRETGSLATFYIRRWFRTLPLFWLFLGVNVLLGLFLRGQRYGLGEILTHGFFLRNLATLNFKFFGESWSLAVEEWFYLLFPAFLWLGLKVWKRFDAVFLSTAAAFFLFSTIARAMSAPHPWATWTEWQRQIVIFRFDSLMLGVFAAWFSVRFKSAWRAALWPGAIVGAALALAMYATLWKFSHHQLLWSGDDYFDRTYRFTFVSLGFALLLPFASNWKLQRETFLSTTIRRIALWSYGLYLVHWPIVQIVTGRFFKDWKTSAPQAWAGFFVTVIGATVSSALLYHFFESRCTHLRDKVAPKIAELFGGRRANNFASTD
jgi:peptidoglycan/LPS O-acetylase OafA/YrhL